MASHCSFFTLIFSVVGVPMSLWRFHLDTVHNLGIHRVVTDVPTTWAGMDVSSHFLSHSLYIGIFVCCANSKPSPLLGQQCFSSCYPCLSQIPVVVVYLMGTSFFDSALKWVIVLLHPVKRELWAQELHTQRHCSVLLLYHYPCCTVMKNQDFVFCHCINL